MTNISRKIAETQGEANQSESTGPIIISKYLWLECLTRARWTEKINYSYKTEIESHKHADEMQDT